MKRAPQPCLSPGAGDPNERVREAIRHVFDAFDRVGTAGGVVRYFRENGLKVPTVSKSLLHLPEEERVQWVRLTMSRVVYILNNPAYAGAYSYGRRMTVARPLPDNPTEVKKYEVLRNFEDWMLIRDRHEGYISWEQYLQNRERLADNCNWGRERPKRPRGAALAGNALLQGVVSCGVCGRRMRVSYNHSKVNATTASRATTTGVWTLKRTGAYRTSAGAP